jgi:hypothetical protein
MGRETEKTTVNIAAIHQLADKISELAQHVRDGADSLERRNIRTIQLEMLPTLRDGIDDISKWIGKTTEIISRAGLLAGFPPLPEKGKKESNAAKESIASARKQGSRKEPQK